MANKNVILQWNCRGLAHKRNHLLTLISDYKPAVICLQETLLKPDIEKSQNDVDNLPKYVQFKNYKGYFKCIPSGRNGLAIYVRNGVLHSPINLRTGLQALAVRITFQSKEFVVSNHYISDTHDQIPSKGQFNNIIHQFDKPYILVGDFNAHNTLWSHAKNDKRGDVLEEFMYENDLGLLNSNVKTRYDPNSHKFSLLDLSIVHPALYLDFESKVLKDSYDSDHNPIIITLNGDLQETDKIPRYNFKRANWDSFRVQCRNELTVDIFDHLEDDIKVFSEKLIEIATDNIPMTSPFHKKCSKPWFDDDCKAAKRERNKACRLNRRYPCLANHIKVKVASAHARRTYKRKKRESWKNYVSNINSRTPTKKVWNMISKITGKNIPRHLLHLKDTNSGELITNNLDIANKIGETFEKNSSSLNYSEDFRRVKQRDEEKPLNFNTNETFAYNKPFKLRDLKRSIKKSKDSTPGPDGIHYRLLKNLPDSSLKVLLDIINKHWNSQTFPESWREAILIPIPKPGKDHSDPGNFRPIALTSCVCKTVERMVNERLIYYLEKKNILSKFQAGFRKERSTIDQLIRLDTFIKDAFKHRDHVVGVFFDLAKAYDTTWKYGIMRDLHEFGLRGNLPLFIQNFLSERTFQILLCTTITTDTFYQEEGVPQGAILSTTLFNVKLNGIARELSRDIGVSLYVDDFVIFFRGRTVEFIERQLQININKIVRWTTKNGFTVSSNKTVAMYFCNCTDKLCSDPILNLGSDRIKFVKQHKFLGLIWDSGLTFHAHIQNLLKKCRRAMNIIKILSYSNWGSDTKTLLKLFRTLVRSKIDYGCFVYRTASEDDLEALNVFHRQGIRLCLGAFKSSPIESLYVEANEPPLELRRDELAMRYSLKIKSNPNNPVYDSLYNLPFSDLYEHEPRESLPLGEYMQILFEEAHVDRDVIAKSKIPEFPIWQSESNDVNFNLSAYDKSTTSPYLFKSKFISDILPEYQDYLHVYTDGSKQDSLASFGVHCEYGNLSNRLTDDSSIFTAEIEAINQSLRYIKMSPRLNKKFVIFCDSKSVLESIENQDSSNPHMIKVLDILQELKRLNFTVKFCWIPSHVGIHGNESADRSAKLALTNINNHNIKIPYTDLIPNIKQFIRQRWQQRWDYKHYNKRVIKLHYFLPTIKPFYINNLCRKDEVIIHRIRIGHTRLTHRHLMEDRPEPRCHFCDAGVVLSIKHILIDCLYFSIIRSRYYNADSMGDLFMRFPLKYIIEFLKEARLYHLI